MLSPIAIVMMYLFLQMCLVWILYRTYNNPSIVDCSWSIGLMNAGLIYLFAQEITPRKIIIATFLIIWALRLAIYLWYTRVRVGHHDKRYTNMSSQWKINQSLGFFLNFQLQAFLIFIISFIFFLISLSSINTLSHGDYIAMVIILAGILGEAIADLQLWHFKKTHPGAVCNVGLWRYSRHPNYFFDWLTWFGFTLFALQISVGYFAFISLGVLYIIFTQITGPITEQGSIQSRGKAYLDYQAKTSMFFPWFKYKY